MSRVIATTVLAAAIVAGTAFLGPAPALAEIEDGEKAPLVRPRDFVNTAPIDFKKLLGRVVLVNVFRTANKACREQADHLDELHVKYGPKGLLVVSVTSEARTAVEKFATELKVEHALVSEEGESIAAFGCGAIPTAFLIDVEGRIAWSGHPGNLFPDVIETALRAVRDVPRLPASLAVAQRCLDERRFGDARKALEKTVADEKASEADRKAATDAITWIDGEARHRMDEALADSIRGDALLAAEAYARIAEAFRGTAAADAAAKALKELLADPAAKADFDAARSWAELRPRVIRLDSKKAMAALRKFVAERPRTKAAAEAQAMLDKLVAEEAARKAK